MTMWRSTDNKHTSVVLWLCPRSHHTCSGLWSCCAFLTTFSNRWIWFKWLREAKRHFSGTTALTIWVTIFLNSEFWQESNPLRIYMEKSLRVIKVNWEVTPKSQGKEYEGEKHNTGQLLRHSWLLTMKSIISRPIFNLHKCGKVLFIGKLYAYTLLNFIYLSMSDRKIRRSYETIFSPLIRHK